MPHDVLERLTGVGYLVVHDVFDPTEVDALRDGVEAAVQQAVGLVATADPARVTSWVNPLGHLLQNVGGTALHSTSIHWEPDVTPATVRNLRPVTHLDARLDALWPDQRLTEPAARVLGAQEVCPLTSKISVKRARVGSEFIWHQDHGFLAPFLGDQATEVVIAMVVLDDADADNGALWLVPGTHHGGPRQDHDGPRSGDAAPVRLDAPAGTVVFFPSLMVHRSDANHSARDRRALFFLYQPAERSHLDETPKRSTSK